MIKHILTIILILILSTSIAISTDNNFKEIRILKQSTGETLDLNLQKLSPADIPEIPKYILPLTEVFFIKHKYSNEVNIEFSVNNSSNKEVDIRYISLYHFTEVSATTNKGHVIDNIWVPISDINYRKNLGDIILSVPLKYMPQGMYFWGIER